MLAQLVVGQVTVDRLYFYINDHLGVPRVIVDEAGAVVWAADYLPFGQTNVNIETVVNNFRFAGQCYDDETGLHYNYHRYYDPRNGRYLTPDPIGLAGGINLYAYANLNPINKTDPFGLLVQVGQHPAFINHPINPYSHAAIVLRPDNPADFRNHPLFAATNGTQSTLSAHALYDSSNGPLILISTPNFPGDAPCNLNDLTGVPAPPGMTDTEFINRLIAADRSYGNNTVYNPWPYNRSYQYNSNSYVSGVIIAAGGTPPVFPGERPGYDFPLPLVVPHRGDLLH